MSTILHKTHPKDTHAIEDIKKIFVSEFTNGQMVGYEEDYPRMNSLTDLGEDKNNIIFNEFTDGLGQDAKRALLKDFTTSFGQNTKSILLNESTNGFGQDTKNIWGMCQPIHWGVEAQNNSQAYRQILFNVGNTCTVVYLVRAAAAVLVRPHVDGVCFS